MVLRGLMEELIADSLWEEGRNGRGLLGEFGVAIFFGWSPVPAILRSSMNNCSSVCCSFRVATVTPDESELLCSANPRPRRAGFQSMEGDWTEGRGSCVNNLNDHRSIDPIHHTFLRTW